MLIIPETKEEFTKRTQKEIDDKIERFNATHATILSFLSNIPNYWWIKEAQQNLVSDPEGQLYSRGILEGINKLLEAFDEDFYTYVHLSYERAKENRELRNQLLYRKFSLDD